MTENLILLNDTELDPAVASVRKDRQDADDGDYPINDYKRWSIVLNKLNGRRDLLDIGIGLGQFPDAAMRSGRFERVRGADFKPHSRLRKDTDFEFIQYNLTNEPAPDLRAEAVTCLECIEHIKDPAFDVAVANLKALAGAHLIVTVPFMEKEPIQRYHAQRFTLERLRKLFPGGDITLLAIGRIIRWAMVDWHPAAQN